MVSLLPATATVIGIIVLGQVPTAKEATGVALVIAGVALHRERARHPERGGTLHPKRARHPERGISRRERGRSARSPATRLAIFAHRSLPADD
jgi:hypothetical protein